MARVEWSYNYDFSGGKRYYYTGPVGQFDQPLTAWVIDYLNTSRNRIRTRMLELGAEAEQMIKLRSRVDTGLMQSMAMHRLEEQGDVLTLVFGWDADRPYYAPFQEFGTRDGIEPMLAVYTAFLSTRAQLTEALGRGIT